MPPLSQNKKKQRYFKRMAFDTGKTYLSAYFEISLHFKKVIPKYCTVHPVLCIWCVNIIRDVICKIVNMAYVDHTR